MPADHPFVDAYADELHAAAVRLQARAAAPRRRPVLVPVAAAVAGVALVVGTLLGGLRPHAADASVRVQVEEGRVIVTLVDLEHRPEEIEAAVRAAGLDVSVVAVPVGPSEVGRFVGEVASDLPAELRVVDGGRSTFAGFSLPTWWRGSLHLEVGRPARAGETYAAFSDALAPGEPLACTGLLGRPAAQAVPPIAARGLHAAFLASALGGSPRRIAAADLHAAGVDAWVVVAASATAADHVVIEIAPPPTGGPPPGSVPC
jgi:hypothetical protein